MLRTLITITLLSLLITSTGCRKTHRVEVEEGRATYYEGDEVIAQLNEVWEKTYLTAKGEAAVPPGYDNGNRVGRDLARDHALLEARANLYSQLGEIKLTENISVLDGAVRSHRTSEMKGVVAGSEIIGDYWNDTTQMYIVSIQLPQVKLVKYVMEWVDNGIVDPEQLKRQIIRPGGN